MRVLVGEGGEKGRVGGGLMERLKQNLRGGRPFLREGTESCTGYRAAALASYPRKPYLPSPCDLCHLCIAGRGREGGEKSGVRWDGSRGGGHKRGQTATPRE